MKRPSKTAVEQRLIGESCIVCHACCHHLVLKVNAEDMRRNPQIALSAEEYEPNRYRLVPRKVRIFLPSASGRSLARKGKDWNFYCPFLSGIWTCTIYDTRPGACQRFKRGSTACHEQRKGHIHYANQG